MGRAWRALFSRRRAESRGLASLPARLGAGHVELPLTASHRLPMAWFHLARRGTMSPINISPHEQAARMETTPKMPPTSNGDDGMLVGSQWNGTPSTNAI
jgi:hypothetical protein